MSDRWIRRECRPRYLGPISIAMQFKSQRKLTETDGRAGPLPVCPRGAAFLLGRSRRAAGFLRSLSCLDVQDAPSVPPGRLFLLGPARRALDPEPVVIGAPWSLST